jgi:methionyl-tRNA formyltransferase
MMNVLLVAEESAGIQTLRMLTQSEHEVVGVMTTCPTRGGGATVASAASALEIPVLPSERVREPSFADWIRAHDIDLLFNVHSLFVIDADVIRAPRIGAFNLHPGPLPEYAGLNAPSWAIYFGETRHAVTLHWMDAEIDTGAIAYSAEFAIDEKDTGLSLSARCVQKGMPLIAKLLDTAAVDPSSIPRVAQDLSRRRYFGREAPDGGRISWGRSAQCVVAFVRACDYFPFASPWGSPASRINGRDVAVLKAIRTGLPSAAEPGTVGEVEDGAVQVAAQDEWVRVSRVQPEGGRPVLAAEVLTPGTRFVDETESVA